MADSAAGTTTGIQLLGTVCSSSSRNEPSRQRTFQQLPLTLPGRELPPSLPLILPSNLEYDPATNTIKKLTDGVESSGPPQLCLSDDALKLLQNINKPVAVLAICGTFRSGKSYFLSHMLGSNDAFKVGHEMHGCTRGIWMATTALECEEFVLLLLDTEGIDATGVNKSHSTTARNILVLSTLASSFLIYNSKNVPRQSDLDKMSCFAQLSSCIQTEAESDDLPDHYKHFPDLLWLLRDVDLEITDEDGKPLTPTEYVKSQVLDPGIRSTNDDVVKAIRTLFPPLECQIIPHPMTQNPAEDHSPEFSDVLDEVIQCTLQSIKAKKGYVKGGTVDGPILAALLGQYVSALNSGPQISLESSWLRAIRPRLEDLAQRALADYKSEMANLEPFLPLEEDALALNEEGITTGGSLRSEDDVTMGGSLRNKDDVTMGGSLRSEGDVTMGGSLRSEDDVTMGGSLRSKVDVATGGPPESEGDVATGGPPESEGDVATGGPPESEGDVATGGPPGSEGDIATGGPPESEGDVATGGPPESESDVATDGPPESKGDIATGGPPESEGDVATAGPPGSEGDIATGGPPESEGDVATGGPLESEGDVTTGGPPESKGDVATGGSPESESDIATGRSTESKSDIATGRSPESESDIATGGSPESEVDVATGGSCEGEGRSVMISTYGNGQAPQTLVGIHRRILDAKLTILQCEMDRIIPVSSAATEAVKSKIFTDLNKQIAEYECDQEGLLKVKGGVLYQFIVKNYQKSRERCEEVFTQVYSPLMENFNQPFDDKVNEYMTRAVGPAKQPVFEKRKRELFDFSTRLTPGPPQNLKAVGRGSQCIKIRWEPPTLHLLLTHHYSVEIRKTKDSGSMWSEVKKTKRMYALVTKLNSDTKYSFRVRGVTALMLVGNPSEEVHTETKFSAAARTATAVAAGVGAGVAVPITLLATNVQIIHHGIKEKHNNCIEKGVFGVVVCVPCTTAFYPVMAPLGGIAVGMRIYRTLNCEGDLSDSEPSDYEELDSETSQNEI